MSGGTSLHIHTYAWINTSKSQWLKYVCTISSNTQKFYVLPTKCIYVFFLIVQSTNSDYLWILVFT